jgi:hypothetical protein
MMAHVIEFLVLASHRIIEHHRLPMLRSAEARAKTIRDTEQPPSNKSLFTTLRELDLAIEEVAEGLWTRNESEPPKEPEGAVRDA